MIDSLRNDRSVSSLLINVHLQGTQGPGGEGGFPTGRQRAGRRGGFRLPHEVHHRGASAGQGDLQATLFDCNCEISAGGCFSEQDGLFFIHSLFCKMLHMQIC